MARRKPNVTSIVPTEQGWTLSSKLGSVSLVGLKKNPAKYRVQRLSGDKKCSRCGYRMRAGQLVPSLTSSDEDIVCPNCGSIRSKTYVY